MDIIGRPEIFLTSVALLTAILVVWAQQWVSTYNLYKEKAKIEYKPFQSPSNRIEFYTNAWLSWNYLAIFISLTSTSFAVISYLGDGLGFLLEAAIGLFCVSLYMTIVQVSQSLYSAFYKTIRQKAVNEPSTKIGHGSLFCIMIILVVFGIMIFLSVEKWLLHVDWLFY